MLFFVFLKSGQNATKFAVDTNFVTYCLNYFVSGLPFNGLANSNVSESIMKRTMLPMRRFAERPKQPLENMTNS